MTDCRSIQYGYSIQSLATYDTIFNSSYEIANANYPKIRIFKVPFNMAAVPLDSVGGKWIITSPETAGNYSATAFFYARKLFRH